MTDNYQDDEDDYDDYDECFDECGDYGVASSSAAFQPMEHAMRSLEKKMNTANISQVASNDIKRGEKKQAGYNKSQGRDDRATTEQVMDPRTRLILFKMLNRGVFDTINGCISTGKEANVYHATSKEGKDIAVKVFKTSILVFKDRDKYVSGEHRFKSGYSKGNPRKMVKLWAEKEMRNLKRLHVAGIPCPEPRFLRMHILLMDFIGADGWPAPRLKDATLSDTKVRSCYVQCLKILRRMFQQCRLVHGDFSEYNLLYFEGTVYCIDVSQSVEFDHPRALEFLRLDCSNTNIFFTKKGLTTMSLMQIFQFVVDKSFGCEEEEMDIALDRIQTQIENSDEPSSETEIEQNVFMKSFIATNLSQVMDIEKEADRIAKEGPCGDRKFFHMFTGVDTNEPVVESVDEECSLEEDEDTEEEEEEGDKEKPFVLKNADKETKKAHKKLVKDDKKEKRLTKIPKHIKKRNQRIAKQNSKKG